MWRETVAVFLLMQVGTSSLGAQNQLLLRYDPLPDVTVHTLFQTVAKAVTGDGRVIETADLGSMRSIALKLEDGGTVLHMTYDSVRARIRSGGEEWREFTVPGADSVWVQANVDDRLNVSASWAGSPLPAVTGLIDILTGLPDLSLPAQPVRLGGAWLIDSELPERIVASVPQEVVTLPSLTFSTRIRLDSMVQRAQDTLGYFTVTGDMKPTSETDLRSMEAEGLAISSELDGQLVWSSGWSCFVSGANRVTMEITKSRQTGAATIEQLDPALTMTVTTRFRVQP